MSLRGRVSKIGSFLGAIIRSQARFDSRLPVRMRTELGKLSKISATRLESLNVEENEDG
jgi:hypothetical protein